MKKLLLVLALFTLSASAFAFRVNAQININDQRAEAVVYNQWPRPIVCSGQLQAIDANGNWVNQWMNNTVIYPGKNAFLYAQVWGYNYIRDARANINCRWF